jgi:drug/metabolite transporter (DMT)-like permease
MDRLGASITSCLTNATPLFATLFAVSFLNEQPSVTNLLGTLSIVAGIVALSWRGATKTWRTRDLLFPLTAAFLFAARDNMVRLAPKSIRRWSAPPSPRRHRSTVSVICFSRKKPLQATPARLPALRRRWFSELLSYAFAYTALSMGVSR